MDIEVLLLIERHIHSTI